MERVLRETHDAAMNELKEIKEMHRELHAVVKQINNPEVR
jgi:hypothetical protein